jgi:hypothetical protein
VPLSVEQVGSSFTIGVAGLTLCNAVVARGHVVEAATRYRDLIAHVGAALPLHRRAVLTDHTPPSGELRRIWPSR